MSQLKTRRGRAFVSLFMHLAFIFSLAMMLTGAEAKKKKKSQDPRGMGGMGGMQGSRK